MKKQKVTIFLYNRLFDALIQSNFWLYIKDYLYNENSSIDFYLITYEDPKFPLTNEQKALVEEWKSLGLKWKPLTWNPGIGFKAKTSDIVNGFWAVRKLKRMGYDRVVSLASVAGTFVFLYSTILDIKYFLYQFEPHSEYARDNGMWPKDGWQYKISHFLERKAAESAKVIASGTRFMQERLKEEWKVQAEFFKIATVANVDKFVFNQSYRDEIRKQYQIDDDQKVLFYPGKFGGLYYKEETAFMYKWLEEDIPNIHFLIVTPHTNEEVQGYFEQAGVSKEKYTIARSEYENIHKYYCAADLAVIAVPRGPSKVFISNIKVGEYLCCGLPYLITEGVSEDYLYATEKNVGVVVSDFDENSIKNAVPEVNDFFEMDKSILRERCRAFGLEYRGFERLNRTFKQAIASLTH